MILSRPTDVIAASFIPAWEQQTKFPEAAAAAAVRSTLGQMQYHHPVDAPRDGGGRLASAGHDDERARRKRGTNAHHYHHHACCVTDASRSAIFDVRYGSVLGKSHVEARMRGSDGPLTSEMRACWVLNRGAERRYFSVSQRLCSWPVVCMCVSELVEGRQALWVLVWVWVGEKQWRGHGCWSWREVEGGGWRGFSVTERKREGIGY